MHITVNGTPWCEAVSRRSTWGTDSLEVMGAKYDEMLRLSASKRMLVICMHSAPTAEAAVKLLRSLGVNAEVTQGDCPTLKDQS